MKDYIKIGTLIFVSVLAVLLILTWLTQSIILSGIIVLSILFSIIIALLIKIKDEIISYIDYISSRGNQ
ncbi:MAG: hypothetical protein ACI4XS_06865 [Bacillus sp. (in: firmicutes)]